MLEDGDSRILARLAEYARSVRVTLMSCPICEKRPAKRYCPAKGEKICAVCCGKERERTIDCPADCSYLIQAHRYEAEHRQPLTRDEFPYPNVEFPVEFVYDHWPVVMGLANTIGGFQAQHKDLNDGLANQALHSLAEAYHTLERGIYYEKPPVHPAARELYAQLGNFLQEYRKEETNRTGFSSLKDSEIFRLLVFLLRIAKQESNGRPLSRAFLAFLRERFPMRSGHAEAEAPRIIVP